MRILSVNNLFIKTLIVSSFLNYAKMGTWRYNHRNGNNPYHEIATLYKRKVVGNKQKTQKKQKW